MLLVEIVVYLLPTPLHHSPGMDQLYQQHLDINQAPGNASQYLDGWFDVEVKL